MATYCQGSMTLKFGVIPINVGAHASPATATAIVETAEAAGLESAWTFEHVVMPTAYASAYPYHPKGKMFLPSDTAFVDPLVAIAHAIGKTRRLRFGTGINILPQANPLLVAKQVACLDYLSGGRMMLGVGAGWLREEFEALGAPFAQRGKRMDDAMRALRAAWNGGGEVTYRSEFIDWSGFALSPQPVQAGGVPLIVGGTSPAAIRRAATLGDGWFVIHQDMAQLRALMHAFHAECRAAGRDPARIEVTAYHQYLKEGTSTLPEYAALGVHRLLMNLVQFREGDLTDNIKGYADTVLASA